MRDKEANAVVIIVFGILFNFIFFFACNIYIIRTQLNVEFLLQQVEKVVKLIPSMAQQGNPLFFIRPYTLVRSLRNSDPSIPGKLSELFIFYFLVN